MTKEGEERGKKRAKMKSRNAVKEEKCTEGLGWKRGKGVLGWGRGGQRNESGTEASISQDEAGTYSHLNYSFNQR